MDNSKKFINTLTLIGWGLLLIWWGLRWSVLISLPDGSGLLGTSVILFGANAIRKSAHISTNQNDTFLGLFCLLSGGTLLILDILDLANQAPVIETFMIALGVLLLGYGIYSSGRRVSESQ